MEWPYIHFVIGQGLLGVVCLLAPIPLLFHAAKQRRRIFAISPGLLGTILFVAFAVTSGATPRQGSSFVSFIPLVGLLLVMGFIPVSIVSLRNRWAGLLHILTIAGALFTSFAAVIAISNDWP